MTGITLLPLWAALSVIVALIPGSFGAAYPAVSAKADCSGSDYVDASTTVTSFTASTLTVTTPSPMAVGSGTIVVSISVTSSATATSGTANTIGITGSSVNSSALGATSSFYPTDMVKSISDLPTSTGDVVRTSSAPGNAFTNTTIPGLVPSTTVITTSYTEICPTGFTVQTTTYTATVCPKATELANLTTPLPCASSLPPVPVGWTTTVTVCTQCAPTPTTVTLTVPCTNSSAPATPVVTVVTCTESCSQTLTEATTLVPTPITTFVTCTESCSKTVTGPATLVITPIVTVLTCTESCSKTSTVTNLTTPIITVVPCTQSCSKTVTQTATALTNPVVTVIPCTTSCSEATTITPAPVTTTSTNVVTCTRNCWKTTTLTPGEAPIKTTIASAPSGSSGVAKTSSPVYNAGNSASGVRNLFSTAITVLLALLV